VRYRVDELAAACGVSVDTVRFYQGKGLLRRPVRAGRIAWYGDEHLDTLLRVRELKDKGFTLESIRRLLSADVDPADAALVGAVADAAPGHGDGVERWMTLEELARRTGVSSGLLAAVEREGLLVPRRVGDEAMYSESDAAAVAAGLRLLDAGIPLAELLALARAHEHAMAQIAERAIDLFDEFVRRPLRGDPARCDADVERLVSAFNDMFSATKSLVAHHFGRVLLNAALERMDGAGAALGTDAVEGGAET
jgi:DNA-binding transcriptional MerR regulator